MKAYRVFFFALFAFLAAAAAAPPRENERVTVEGSVRSVQHERDGYRIELDRGGYSFWVPERSVRGRSDFGIGVSIRLGGIFRRGVIIVDVVDWPSAAEKRRHDDVLTGWIERVDHRQRTMVIRDERTRRLIQVDVVVRDRDWQRSPDFDETRRGDYVTLRGDWTRPGEFEAVRVDLLRPRHW